ncbi:sialin [Aplysia californica]|uniref:Sialin n=1 Tax=Aplysia californica TaxID=6500 RepID=A0ABM1A609_APLCA|nr:sialin [Aplysia californica]
MPVAERSRLLSGGSLEYDDNLHKNSIVEHKSNMETSLERYRNGKEKVPVCCSYRMGVIICCTCSMTVTFATQASMSSAMVCMLEDTDPGTYNLTDTGNTSHSINNYTLPGEDDPWKFDWDKTTQGWVLSALFMGYYISQLPSGVASARFGPKRVVVIGLILVSIFQVLAVPAARLGLGWLYADRAITGLIDGFLYAPTFALVGQWTPRYETSLLFGIVGMGMELGNMFSYGASTVSCEIDIQGGWPFVFYIMAAFGLLTSVMFVVLVSDSPFNNKFISKKEVSYIANTVPKMDDNDDTALIRIPVKEILKSMPVWAIVVSQIGSDWLYYMLISVGPMYLKDVIKLSDFEVNLLSGLPFMATIPAIYLAGYVCDKLVVNKVLTNTQVRKINDAVCKLIPAGVLLAFCFLPEGSTAAAAVLNTIAATALSFSYVSWMANPVDLAPAYTGFIVGVCEVGAVWVAIVVPIFFDSITINKERSEWQLAYYITVGLQFFSLFFYCVFASGELQPWALHTYKHKYEQLPGNNNDEDEDKNKQKMLGFSEPGTSYSGHSGSLDSVGEEKKKARKNDDLMATLAASLVETLPDVEADGLRDPSSQPRSRSNTQQAVVIMYSAPADDDVKLESGNNHPVDYKTSPSSGERQQSVSLLDEILQADKEGGVTPTTTVFSPSPESGHERQGQGQYNHIPFSPSGQAKFNNTNGDGHLITEAGHNVGGLNSDPTQQKLSSPSVATMQIHTSEAIGKRSDIDDVSPVSSVSSSSLPESATNHKGKGKGGKGKKSKGGKSSRSESSSSGGSFSGSNSSLNDKGRENESEAPTIRRRRAASEGKVDDSASPTVLVKPENVANGDGIHSQNSSSIMTPVNDSLATKF